MHNQFDYVQMKYTVMSQKTEMKCNLYTFLDVIFNGLNGKQGWF